jgi:hypothetical protein
MQHPGRRADLQVDARAQKAHNVLGTEALRASISRTSAAQLA